MADPIRDVMAREIDEELRREQASSIIVPGAAPPTGGDGPGGRILR